MQVLVFKTNIWSRKSVYDIMPLLENVKEIQRWTVDLHDVDKVLRIETTSLTPVAIEKIIQRAGYYCKELD
jgi:hypothetical protein